MSDTVCPIKVKKNTTKQQQGFLRPYPLLLIMSRGMAICDTWMTRVLSRFARAYS